MKMLVTLLLIALTSLTLGSVMDKCPDPSDSKLKLEANTASVLRSYNRLRTVIRNARPIGNYLYDMATSNRCKQPQFPDDDPNKQAVRSGKGRKDRSFQNIQLEILERTIFPNLSRTGKADFLQVTLKRSCEPCPAKQHFLGRFYGSCYVLAASQQQVRYVTCNKRCFAPCMCSRSYCQRTAYVRVWFFSYCLGRPGQTFPGGFQPGLNFRYLWLPQDCTCTNV